MNDSHCASSSIPLFQSSRTAASCPRYLEGKRREAKKRWKDIKEGRKGRRKGRVEGKKERINGTTLRKEERTDVKEGKRE